MLAVVLVVVDWRLALLLLELNLELVRVLVGAVEMVLVEVVLVVVAVVLLVVLTVVVRGPYGELVVRVIVWLLDCSCVATDAADWLMLMIATVIAQKVARVLKVAVLRFVLVLGVGYAGCLLFALRAKLLLPVDLNLTVVFGLGCSPGAAG